MSASFDRAVAYVRAHGDEFDQGRLDLLLGGPSLSNDQQRRFLAGQRADGGWPPFWAPDASSLDATCYRLAQAEGLHMGTCYPQIARGVAFIRARQRDDGSWEEDEALHELAPPCLHAHWLAAGLWIRLGRQDLADCVLDTLATRVTDDVAAGALAWILVTLGGLGIAPDHPLGQTATSRLASLQRADGGWTSEDGPNRDPIVTVEALRGLRKWAAI